MSKFRVTEALLNPERMRHHLILQQRRTVILHYHSDVTTVVCYRVRKYYATKTRQDIPDKAAWRTEKKTKRYGLKTEKIFQCNAGEFMNESQTCQ